jgi:hypothetical protein
MSSDTVYCDYLELNSFLETIRREDLVERQRTLAKRLFSRILAREFEDDINGAKPLLANRNSILNQVIRVVWKDKFEEKVSRIVRKAGELARNLETDVPNPWLVWKVE